jgi:1-acyl-sn-glycerol-3-phosphate acyltransferase
MSRLYRPKAGFCIRLLVSFVYPTAGLLFRIRWHHLDRIPPPSTGGVMIAANHTSHIDTFLVARICWQAGRIPRFLVKAGLFHIPLLGRLVRGAGQIPVYRGTPDASDSLHDARVALDRGEAVVIYPEGTMTTDPAQWPMQGRTGIARLVLARPDIPVVPIGQWGAQHRRHLPLWRRPRRRTSLASVGHPLDLSRYSGKEPSAEALREITDVIMDAVRAEVAELRGEPAPVEFFVPTHKYVDRPRTR